MKTCFCTKNGPKAVGPYSTAVIAGDTVYVSGMIPLDPKTNQLVAGGVEGQAVQAMENVRVVLEELGLTMAHVVRATVYLTDLNDFAVVNTLYKERFGPDYPARSCVQVAKLPMGAQIEIEVTAVK